MAMMCTHVGDEQSLESKIVQWCYGRAGAVVPREGGAEQRLQAYELTAE